jgi:hypothetical protein
MDAKASKSFEVDRHLGPRVKVKREGSKSVWLGTDHPNETIGKLALLRGNGTTDLTFR